MIPEYDNCTPICSNVGPLPWYGAFTNYTPTIPKFYWDVYSQEQRIKHICMELHKLAEYSNAQTGQINTNASDIKDLQEAFKKFIESGFDDYYYQQIMNWVDSHMTEIMERATKQVYFGLNDDGHFVVYVPDSWSDITFDTGMVFGRTDYGRLILRFEADGALDNTYSYSMGQPKKVDQLIADLETDAKRTDACFDTLFTNLDKGVILNGNI